MKPLPSSEIYEAELMYMPYKKSLEKALDIVVSSTPKNSKVIDLMCGPGYLLGRIKEKREDLNLLGIDVDKEYIKYAQSKYPSIKFEDADILTWDPGESFDVVLCTGALHHITYKKQEGVIRKLSRLTGESGFCLLSDCYIDDYTNEEERKLGAAKLGYYYLKETIKNKAPDEIVSTLIDILHNDVLMDEFKTSLKKRLPLIKKAFSHVNFIKTWPEKGTGYGDYIAILKK